MSDNLNKNRVIIVQNEEKEKKGPRLSWAIYGKGIHHFRWWIIGGTLAFGILGYIGCKFLYNPKKETLTTTITPSLVLNDDKSAYLDGTPYRANDIISKENIEKVLENNPQYKYTYEQLMESNTFNISPTEITSADGATINTFSTYTLTTKPGSFKSEKEARSFIRLLVNYEAERSRNAISSFSFASALVDEDSFLNLSFDNMVESLNTQSADLKKDYEKMIQKFGYNVNVEGKNLSQYYSNLNYYYSTYQFKSLSGQLSTNKYVNVSTKEEARQKIYEYEDLKATYEKRFASIAATLNTDLNLFEKLVGINTGTGEMSDSLAVQITELSTEIKNLQAEQSEMIEELTQIGYNCRKDNNNANDIIIEKSEGTDNYLAKLNEYIASPDDETDWSKGCVRYKTVLMNYYKKLNEDTTNASELLKTICSTPERNNMVVKESNMGTLNGHMPSIVLACVGLVLGFVILSFVFSIVEMNFQPKKKEEKKDSQPTVEAKE